VTGGIDVDEKGLDATAVDECRAEMTVDVTSGGEQRRGGSGARSTENAASGGVARW
jgi:hypothetical protein